jgi:hypothetical protein
MTDEEYLELLIRDWSKMDDDPDLVDLFDDLSEFEDLFEEE